MYYVIGQMREDVRMSSREIMEYFQGFRYWAGVGEHMKAIRAFQGIPELPGHTAGSDLMLDIIRAKVETGERITGEEGLYLLQDARVCWTWPPWPKWFATGTTRSQWLPSS